jgi:Alpha-L-rhamnosidase N-terminal domain./Bacterial alpha-L-rhamnosidase.
MFKKALVLLFFVVIACNSSFGQVLSLKDVKCNFVYDSINSALPKPVFSWKLISTQRDIVQTGYEIKIAKNKKDLSSGKNSVCYTDKKQSSRSIHIPYEGPALASRQQYYWQVRVWDNKGNSSKSPIMEWTNGLSQSDWEASWIGTTQNETSEQVVLFRKEFDVVKPIEKANLYITSHGIYQAEINSLKIGDQLLTPGWTSYHKRLQYQQYDVTHTLSQGNNAIMVSVAEGWYKGPLLAAHHVYGNKIALLSQLEIVYKDGSKKTIISDETWKTSSDGPIISSGLYSGETYDARKEKAFSSVSFVEDTMWHNAVLAEKQEYGQLISSIAPPVKRQEIIKPKQIIITPQGDKVIDFGQNLIGRARFTVNGTQGDSILLSHAEVLDKDGNFYTRNLRTAKQHLAYYLRGNDIETYEPVFTFQGFQYIRVEGNRELIDINNIEAVVIHSDLEQTGTFSTSNPLLNQLQHNILWGQKSNFLDIPTDCPQRDERLGWTGDAQVFFNTATFNMDVSSFFTKWLADLRVEQLENGGVPGVIPNIWGTGENNIGQAGWADAATIIPWQYYKAYGDEQVLKDSYHSMQKWVEYIASRSTGHLWNKSWHHGDWLHYMPQNVWDKAPAYTDKTVIAQAFYANSVQNIINTAEVLGKNDDVAKYKHLLQQIKDTFVAEFVSPAGAIMSNTQTAYVLALQFDLLPENMRDQAAQRLANLVNEYDVHISTGFLGTPYICHVLSRFGYQDLAYKLLLQESYPSWLYPVKMGATTIWERWDGIRADGTFQDEAMNSFNHYAYGAIGNWMYKNIGGIDQQDNSVGYKNIIIAPQIGGGISESKTEFETVYGKVVSSWNIHNQTMFMYVEIPPNTTAKIVFPSERKSTVNESGKIIPLQSEQNTYPIGSGKYSFSFEVQ